MSDQNKNPFLYFWDLATGGLLSASSDKELTPNKRAGKIKKVAPKITNKPIESKAEPSKKTNVSQKQER